MSVTVIDELVITLGLDPRQFTEAQRDALASFKKTKEGAVDFGKEVEAQGMKMSEVFGIARKGALGVLGAFVGGEAAAFIDHVVTMDAATGRWAKTIGTSVENLGIWQGMIRQVGGAAEEATSSMSALQSTINNVMSGNGLFDNQFGFLLNKIGGAQGKNADQIMRELQAYFASQIGSGQMTATVAATQMGWVPGMNQSMINLLLSDFKKIEAAAREVGGATQETADAAEKLQSRFSLIIQAMERFGASLLPFLDLLTKPVGELKIGDAADVAKSILPGVTFDKGSVMDRLDTWLWGEYGQHGASPAAGGSAAAGPGGRSSPADREAWIRSFAATLGIDPDTALRVSRSEGFSGFQSGIAGEQSFGDFQLHITPGGRGRAVGDEFQKATGLDPRDPANEKAMDLFALQHAAQYGWGDFHGAANTGIGAWQGIGARSAAAGRSVNNNTRSTSSTSSSEVNIGNININAPNATDSEGIAGTIGPAMKRSTITSPANSGLN